MATYPPTVHTPSLSGCLFLLVAAGCGTIASGPPDKPNDTETLGTVVTTDPDTDASTIGTDTPDTDTTSSNLPPVLTSVVLTPDPVHLHEVLSCVAGKSSDPDGDPVDLLYTWRISGVPIGHTEQTIDETWFSIGDEVYCAVTPTDGLSYGSTQVSNTVVILPPEHTGMVGGAKITHRIGGNGSSWSAANYYRGNIYENTDGGVLDNYSVYLGLAADCELDWYVHSGPTADGPWTVAFAGTTLAVAATAQMPSPPAGVLLLPGTYYGVGVAWNCSATYYGDDSGWLGTDAGVGHFQKNYWSNTYTGFDPNFIPSNAGTTSLAYHHEYALTY